MREGVDVGTGGARRYCRNSLFPPVTDKDHAPSFHFAQNRLQSFAFIAAFLGNIAVKLIGLFLKMFDDLRIESRR